MVQVLRPQRQWFKIAAGAKAKIAAGAKGYLGKRTVGFQVDFVGSWGDGPSFTLLVLVVSEEKINQVCVSLCF